MSEFLKQRMPYCGAAKENERCPNVFLCSLGTYKIPLSEEECKFLYGVYAESKSYK